MKILFFIYRKILSIKRFIVIYTFNSFKKGYNISTKVTIGKNVRIENTKGGKISIGENTELMDGVLLLTYGGNITIGKECSINPYTVIYGHGNTTIGNNVLIAGHCMIIPNNHRFLSLQTPIASQGSTSLGIVIKDNVWIGHGCSILDGITIDSGAIIAAGSVVTKDVPKNTIVGGIPAKTLRKR